ncbi:MAG TPA: hypothetical protein VN654_03645 [Vicinamibacterales bacterium]|nr:hypothetical protein [Vicinamibacterales bacterium]
MWKSSEFTAGEWVEVRSREEILSTLDGNGQLDGLPFMPEMLQFCGQRLPVFRRAHKTCDPPNGLQGRRMAAAVHLDGVRCDGSAHGGCQAGCLMFWKDAWLKKADPADDVRAAAPGAQPILPPEGTPETERVVWAGTRQPDQPAEEPRFVCQSTQIAAATTPLASHDLRQYIEDWTSGNVSLTQMIASAMYSVCEAVANAGLGLGSAVRWTYDTVQAWRGMTPYPSRTGRVPAGTKTPSAQLGLQVGELVQVRPYQEILETIDQKGHNRGMVFDGEMVPFCGGTYRVLQRVNRIIDEKTGRMMHMKNECIQLDGVTCQACYAKYRKFCPRSIFPYWREIWLRRAGSDAAGTA